MKLENPDFEKTFDVYSTDQIEARYLLSPSMMERLLALEMCIRDSIKAAQTGRQSGRTGQICRALLGSIR